MPRHTTCQPSTASAAKPISSQVSATGGFLFCQSRALVADNVSPKQASHRLSSRLRYWPTGPMGGRLNCLPACLMACKNGKGSMGHLGPAQRPPQGRHMGMFAWQPRQQNQLPKMPRPCSSWRHRLNRSSPARHILRRIRCISTAQTERQWQDSPAPAQSRPARQTPPAWSAPPP